MRLNIREVNEIPEPWKRHGARQSQCQEAYDALGAVPTGKIQINMPHREDLEMFYKSLISG